MSDCQAEDVVVRILCRNHCITIVYLINLHVFLEVDDLWGDCRDFFGLYHLGEIRLGIGVLGLDRLPVWLVDLILLRESHLRADVEVVVVEIFVCNSNDFIFRDSLNAFSLSEILVVCHAALLELEEEARQ